MRLLFLTNFYPPADLGGWEQWCHEIALGLRARGHIVQVLTSRWGTQRPMPAQPLVQRKLHLDSHLDRYRPYLSLGARSRDRANASALRGLVSSFRPEVIVVWGMWQLDPGLAILAEELCPERVAYYLCGYWPIEPDAHSAYWRSSANGRVASVIKRALGATALRICTGRRRRPSDLRNAACVSQAVLDLLSAGGISLPEARVIYGGIDLERFCQGAPSRSLRSSPEKLRLLHAGQLSPAKGTDTVVNAAMRLAQTSHDGSFTLTLAGSGHPDFENMLRKRVSEHGVGRHVVFRGRVPHEQMPSLIREHDVLLFASVWQEPLARMMMEGLAAGLVLITTTTGGSAEIVRAEENCLTFAPGNDLQLAQQVQRLVTEPGLVRRLSLSGQSTAEKMFDFGRMLDELERHFQCVHKAEADLHCQSPGVRTATPRLPSPERN